MLSDNQDSSTNRVTCQGLLKLLSTNFASSQEFHELSTELIPPPSPTTCYGAVLPPWMLLSWLRMTSRQTRQVIETYSETASKFSTADAKLLSISTYTNTCDLPLDLSTGVHGLSTTASRVEHNPLSKYTAWKPLVTAGHTIHTTIQAQATASCSAYLMAVLDSFMERNNSNGRGQKFVSVTSKSLTNFDRQAVDGAVGMASVNFENPTSYRQVNRHSNAGPGKQPVTRCYQCKDLFPTLFELNAHFMHEHSDILKTELEHAKSWKSHAVESMCSKLSAKQLHSEFEQNLIQGTVNPTGYPCPYCQYFAKWPTELQKHIMVHSKERPHRCVICGLSYKWKWDLGRHFDKSHHKDMNPYKKKNGCVSGITTTRGSKRDSRDRFTASKLHGMKKGRCATLLSVTMSQKTRTKNYQPELNTTSLSFIGQHKYSDYIERTGTNYTTNRPNPTVESNRTHYSIHS